MKKRGKGGRFSRIGGKRGISQKKGKSAPCTVNYISVILAFQVKENLILLIISL